MSDATRGEGGGKTECASTVVVRTAAREGNEEKQAAADPFAGLTGRDRVRAISELIESLSASERRAYQEALRLHRPSMSFDVDSKTSAPAQSTVCQILALLCRQSLAGEGLANAQSKDAKPTQRRKLSPFELGQLSRDIQSAASTAAAPELMRQVAWSIETGALKRFDPQHALHIALKKIRQGQWTRPHRMPPNWSRALSNAPAPETCRYA